MIRPFCIIETRRVIDLSTEVQYDGNWSAIDRDTYDCDFIGGENDEWKCSESGHGSTEAEAVDDLIEQLV